MSDSQWVEKASLQIRAGRSTRSLEYRTARAQRHSDTYRISQHARLWLNNCVWEKKETNRERVRGRWCMVTYVWLFWFLKNEEWVFFYEFVLFSFPPPPSHFILQLICPLEVMSSPCCPQQTQGSLLNADEPCVCECERKLVSMCHMTNLDLHHSIIEKKRKVGRMLWSRWQQENVSGNDFESQDSETQHRAHNWQIDSRSFRQMVGGVLRGHLASSKITVSQSVAYDYCFPCRLQSCHWPNAH